MPVGSDVPNLVNLGGNGVPSGVPIIKQDNWTKMLKKNPAIVAFSLVSSWERGVGKTTSNQCYDSIP